MRQCGRRMLGSGQGLRESVPNAALQEGAAAGLPQTEGCPIAGERGGAKAALKRGGGSRAAAAPWAHRSGMAAESQGAAPPSQLQQALSANC